ncbi:porin [Craterilacuibacter sinensis]|uniref:Porin n=1 Tax=Craterilacuibacter sinensis TaxID=2686017 RepID=A0A845BMN0_9NEIS|nr:porin [Craterilacuibacter sinensis]MXR37605.1 porin [Craterilacuibacter sinensis]
MNKKIIALAVALLPAAAMADVTIYGAIKAGVESVKSGDDGAVTNVDDIGSRIGFKGSEDLGNGLKAIWQVESKLSIDGTDSNGNNTWATRDSFVGFAGDFGKVRIGKLSTYGNLDLESLDTYEYGSKAAGFSTFYRNDTRFNNAVRYDSPDLGGLTFAAAYGFDEAAGSANKWNIGGTYAFSNMFVGVDYLQKDAKVGTDSKQFRIEGGVDANNLYAALSYQYTKSQGGVASWAGDFADAAALAAIADKDVKTNEAGLTVAYTVDRFVPKFSYAKGWDAKIDGDKASDSGYDQWIVGVDYKFSKRTIAGLQYGQIKFDAGSDAGVNGDEKAVSFNVVHKF